MIANALDAIVQAKAASEEPVAEGNLYAVLRQQSATGQEACAEIGPCFEVVLRVGHHRRFSRGAGGAVVACHLGTVHRQHAQRIFFTQVGLGGKGEPLQIIQALDLSRCNSSLGKCLLVKWDVLDTLDGLL